jgi:flavin-dependent dehydrogenase
VRHLCAEPDPSSEIGLCDARTGARSLIWRDTWLSVGDAAWSIDPLSGAGIQRSLSEGFDAASAVAEFLETGEKSVLRRYALGVGASLRDALRRQRAYYQVERRWSGQPFWRRRIEGGVRQRGAHLVTAVV